MSVTVEKLLKLADPSDITLVAGAGGLKNVVSWMHMVENIQIAMFLEGQEIAFITGVGLEAKEDLFDIIKYNFKMKASAVVINVGPFIEKIPEEIIDYCDENSFPLFEVPWTVHMAKIMKIFSEAIFESEQEQMLLASAVKNAIFFPEQEAMYIPALDSYQFLKEWSYCIAIVNITDEENNSVHHSIVGRMNRIIESYIVHEYKNSAVFNMDNQIIIMLADYSQEEAEKIIDEVAKKVIRNLPVNCRSYWGVGECTKSIRCISKSYNKARHALKLQEKTKKYNEVMYYSKFGLYKVIMSVDDDNVLKEYYNKILGVVEEYDEINDTSLLEDLRMFFECECNVQLTAEAMFMHRNSVRYKINKIEDIMGVNLMQQETKTEIQVAFMIGELIKGK